MRQEGILSFLTPLTFLTAACIASLAYHLYVRAQLIAILQTRYPAIWRQLGGPTMMWGFITSGWDFYSLLHWLWLRKDGELEDPEIRRIAQLHRITHVVPLVIFFAGALPAVLGQFDFLLWHI